MWNDGSTVAQSLWQTKPTNGRFESWFAKMRYLSEFGPFSLMRNDKIPCFCENHWSLWVVLLFPRKTARSQNSFYFANRLANQPFFGLVCQSERWMEIEDTILGFGKRGLLEKGSFQTSPFLEILENLEILKNPQTGEQMRIRPFSRDSRESRDFRDSRDSSSEKTPFVMTPFSGPEIPRKNEL